MSPPIRLPWRSRRGTMPVAALEALGYETVVAVKAVQTVRATSPELDLQEVIKRALRLLVKE